jgi:hypothetical protein
MAAETSWSGGQMDKRTPGYGPPPRRPPHPCPLTQRKFTAESERMLTRSRSVEPCYVLCVIHSHPQEPDMEEHALCTTTTCQLFSLQLSFQEYSILVSHKVMCCPGMIVLGTSLAF